MDSFGPDSGCVSPAPGETWSGTAGALRTRTPADRARFRAIRRRFETGSRIPELPGITPIGRFGALGIALPRCPDSMSAPQAERNFRGRLRMRLAGILCRAKAPQGGPCRASDLTTCRTRTGGIRAARTPSCPLALLPSRTDSLDVAMQSETAMSPFPEYPGCAWFGESDGPQRAYRIRLRNHPDHPNRNAAYLNPLSRISGRDSRCGHPQRLFGPKRSGQHPTRERPPSPRCPAPRRNRASMSPLRRRAAPPRA